MIGMTPKALRLSRLAAEQQAVFRDDPQIGVLRLEEAAVRRRPVEARRHVELPNDAARFCLKAVEALLARPDLFSSDEWDGNDYAFMQAFARSLQQQLTVAATSHLA